MAHFSIKNRWTDAVIFEGDGEILRGVVMAAVSSRANLSGADLFRANLSGADLSRADLSDADLSGADLSRADLSDADLSRANLSGADLSGADLSGADLSRANLSGADLSRANLSDADLYRANLYGADLYRATGIDPQTCTPLLMLLDQPGKIRAYKLVTADGVGPYNGGIKYEIGRAYEVTNANTDITEQCGAGINLATLDWCLRNHQDGYRVLIAEFEATDIAAIPTATDGKFRVHRCVIVGEKEVAKPTIKIEV